MGDIKGILIDSGRVLNIASTGSWSNSPNFFNIVGKKKFKSISKKERQEAYSKAWKYVDSIKYVQNIDEEIEVFKEFFNILSTELPQLEINKEKKILLTEDMVLNSKKYKFFDDVFKVIPRLSEKYKLCIVSDAWPSLREVYKNVGLDKYFTSMIISSELGVTKPNEKMYKKAIESIGLTEKEVIFVDDNPRNCDGAKKLGINTMVLERVLIRRLYDRLILKSEHKIFNNLEQLEIFLKY